MSGAEELLNMIASEASGAISAGRREVLRGKPSGTGDSSTSKLPSVNYPLRLIREIDGRLNWYDD